MARITHFAKGLAVLALAAGCDREADPLLCGDLGTGDLVITELRGAHDISDTAGQWIELHNATGATVDLLGVTFTQRDVEDKLVNRELVRRSVMIGAGEYAVLGKFAEGTLPAHVDYGWGISPQLELSGILDVTCGTTGLDHLAYSALPDPSRDPDGTPPPGHGTYQFGEMPPTAAGNDDPTRWCVDTTETPVSGSAAKDFLGTPGAPNPGCTP